MIAQTDNRTELTPRQEEILNFIKSHIARFQRPPTVRSIAAQFHIKAPNGAMCHLKALEKKGHIRRDEFTACGISIIEREGSAMDYQWQADGSLVIVTREIKVINGETIDDAIRVRIPKDNLGPLRHILAVGPPPRHDKAEKDDRIIAGSRKDG